MSYFVRFLLLCCTVALAIPTYANALNERDAVFSRQTGKLQIRVHYPITGNARVDADVADWAHQAVDTFQNTYGEEPDLGVPYELETTYSTTRSTPSVLSIVWKTASYTGGAHGNLEITTTTYDMKSGALIDLYDVFENLDTALDVMSRYCTKALTKSLGDMYNDDMLRSGFTAIPVVDAKGKYAGTITEGDFLRLVLHYPKETLEQLTVGQVELRVHHRSVSIDARMEDMVDLVTAQNFVPVVDGRGIFCGIVTRRDVITYLCKQLGN